MNRLVGRFRSFGDKVTVMVTMVSGLAVAVVCTLLSAADYAELRRQTLDAAQAQANMIALNSIAPLVFDDRPHAAEALSVLSAAPHMASAVLFDRSDNQFASYRRKRDPGPEFAAVPEQKSEGGRWLALTAPVADQGEKYGELLLVYDLRHVRLGLWSALLSSLLATVTAMLLAYAVTRRLNASLVRPIGELVETAVRVSATGDYSVRAEKLSVDELGDLTDAFNEMLGQIQQQQDQLRASQAEREALLESERAARGDAERASRMKDDFVATLSHELRTPLTPILGWAQILRGAGHDARTAEGLEVIERNARVQVQIIDDLLDMSRIVSGKVRLDVQRIELAAAVEAAVATVRTAAEAREIELDVTLDPEVGPVRGDPARLQQIVWNLVSNAIKFTGKGGSVRVAMRRVGTHVEIVVGDTGQGIDAGFLPHVFERFRQADSSTTRRHGGLGLGLAIVKQLVELHGGSVRATSGGTGQGATFTVSLPLVTTASSDTARGREPQRGRAAVADDVLPSFDGLVFMVVDDDPDARELLARIIEQCGGKVLRTGSAAEALDLLPEARPSALISDIGMPDADGFELIRRVRELSPEQGGATPAIAVTAFARTEDRTRALTCGYQMHIAKPIEPAELLAAVASLVGRRAKVAAPPVA
ncbi:MAG TPA: ATP-binding protein [Solimonas sp.]|nr:ATP-binding protein [Solimonas sp.]